MMLLLNGSPEALSFALQPSGGRLLLVSAMGVAAVK
jgi:hypothetical protein